MPSETAAATHTPVTQGPQAAAAKPELAATSPLKADETVKFAVMADGANPPLHTPVPAAQPPAEPTQRPLSRTTSQGAEVSSSPASVPIEG